MGAALGKPARLISVPQGLLEWGAAVTGKKAFAQRLFSSLQVDSTPTCQLLGWKPPVSLDQGLLQVAKYFQNL
jgi:nucleoside-diphosphate-sugar epimerase